MAEQVPVQSLIDHIRTSMDVDPWAKEMAEELLKRQVGVMPDIENGSSSYWYVCGECHGIVDIRDAYCKHCGTKIKWK